MDENDQAVRLYGRDFYQVTVFGASGGGIGKCESYRLSVTAWREPCDAEKYTECEGSGELVIEDAELGEVGSAVVEPGMLPTVRLEDFNLSEYVPGIAECEAIAIHGKLRNGVATIGFVTNGPIRLGQDYADRDDVEVGDRGAFRCFFLERVEQ